MPADAASMGMQVGVLRVAGRRPQQFSDGRDELGMVDQRPELTILRDSIGALERFFRSRHHRCPRASGSRSGSGWPPREKEGRG